MVEYVLNQLEPKITVIDKQNLKTFYSPEDDIDEDVNDLLPKRSSNLWWLLIVCYENNGLIQRVFVF